MSYLLNIGTTGQVLVYDNKFAPRVVYPGWTKQFRWYLNSPFKPKSTVLTPEQQKRRSRNYIRFKVIKDQDVGITLDYVTKGIITQEEYQILTEINDLRNRLKSQRITFLDKYRDECDKLGIPKPPEKKRVTNNIIEQVTPLQ